MTFISMIYRKTENFDEFGESVTNQCTHEDVKQFAKICFVNAVAVRIHLSFLRYDLFAT